MVDAVVVGSGPAGVAAALALVEAGIRPIVLDGGARLERDRAAAVERARDEGVDDDFVELLRSAFPVDVDALPLKPVYGSTYAYAPATVRTRQFGAVPSAAVGGFSTVWGAAMLPYSERDHAGWPFGAETLTPHYRAVLAHVPLVGEEDALADDFPLYVAPQVLRTSPQLQSLLDDVRRSSGALRAAGVVGGRSRLAVSAAACDLLGLCMLGCPRGAIWSAGQTLAALDVDPRPGARVVRFEETRGRVVVHLAGGDTIETSRLFVGAGALATVAIVLRSLNEREASVIDSAYYTFPAVRWPRPQHVDRRTIGLTLAQAFIEIDDPAVSRRPVHLQVYGFNDLMLRAVAAKARLSEPLAARLLQPLLGRLLYVQGYLHSDVSPRARATLEDDGILRVDGDPPDRAAAVAVARKLRSLRRALRLEPLTPMLQAWAPGKGFHHGGSFPMRERPAGLETDVLGRLPGHERVHLVDASVFPTVPATTITLPVMANAHRVAVEAL